MVIALHVKAVVASDIVDITEIMKKIEIIIFEYAFIGFHLIQKLLSFYNHKDIIDYLNLHLLIFIFIKIKKYPINK